MAVSPGTYVKLKDGRKLGYRTAGHPRAIPQRRTVLYFHACPGSSRDIAKWDQAARSHCVRIIGIDRPGIGMSSFKLDRSISDFVDDVGELLSQLKISRCTLLGVDAGGAYALCALHRLKPDLVAGLLLVATLLPFDLSRRQDDKPFQHADRIAHCSTVLRTTLRRSRPIATMQRIKRAAVDKLRDGRMVEEWRPRRLLHPLNTIIRLPKSSASVGGYLTDKQLSIKPWYFLPEELHTTRPIIIFHSEDDEITTFKSARALCNLLRHSEGVQGSVHFRRLKGASHKETEAQNCDYILEQMIRILE